MISRSRRHSRRTPWPTMPVAPNMTTFIDRIPSRRQTSLPPNVAPFVDPVQHDNEICFLRRRFHHHEVLAVWRDIIRWVAALALIALEENNRAADDTEFWRRRDLGSHDLRAVPVVQFVPVPRPEWEGPTVGGDCPSPGSARKGTHIHLEATCLVREVCDPPAIR